MKKLSFLVSRQFLALIALIVVGLTIWFVGPLVGVGDVKPLAGIGMRVLTIAMLLAGLLLWLAGGSMSIVFVTLLCLLIWYAAPLLTLGHMQPFEPESSRAIAIAVVLGVFAIYWIFRLLHRMRTDEQFLSRLLEFGGKQEKVARRQGTGGSEPDRQRRIGAFEVDAHGCARTRPPVPRQALSV